MMVCKCQALFSRLSAALILYRNWLPAPIGHSFLGNGGQRCKEGCEKNWNGQNQEMLILFLNLRHCVALPTKRPLWFLFMLEFCRTSLFSFFVAFYIIDLQIFIQKLYVELRIIDHISQNSDFYDKLAWSF